MKKLKILFYFFFLKNYNFLFAKNSNKKIDLNNIESTSQAFLNSLNKSKEDELREVTLENDLFRAQLEKQLSKEFYQIRLELERLKIQKEISKLKKELEIEDIKSKHEEELSKLKREKDIIVAQIELEQAKISKELENFNKKGLVFQQNIQNLKWETELLENKIKEKNMKSENSKYCDNIESSYLMNPLKDGKTLIVSDRKIKLNGIINPWNARYVVDSISFFNNKNSEFPIFLFIEYSPGGSVISGQQILEAIENSKAPIYVVVKGYACSMAAIILTLADRSFALKNSIILHHQPSSYIGWYNVRRAREITRDMEDLHKRFLGRVAKKMGITLEKMDQIFYEKQMDGNWMEYADNAKKIKWVGEVINDIQEIGIQKLPEQKDYTMKNFIEEYYKTGFESINSSEKISITVFGNDYYFIHDPNKIYEYKYL